MKHLILTIPLFLSLVSLGACRKAEPRSSVDTEDSSDASDAYSSNNANAIPTLTACYKGDSWTCAVEAAIVKETNALRTKDLVQSYESSWVARQWSDSEAQIDEISHSGFPDARREALQAEFPEANWTFYAENVAMLQSSDNDAQKIAKQFVNMWNNSPGHRKNMLGDYTYIGVGIARIGSSYYATQIFH